MKNFEIYKYKVVEKINILSIEEREKILKEAGYNLFNISSKNVTIDLLTDSGTSAISDLQLSIMMLFDESYAGSSSFERFLESAQNFCNKKYIIPVHQGRAAEKIIADIFCKEGNYVLSNTHFDTGFAIYRYKGAIPINIPTPEINDDNFCFKGNIDLSKLEYLLTRECDKISHVVMTITNNALGGQPVDIENLKQAYFLVKRYDKPFIIDGCRIAENAILYKRAKNVDLNIREIIHSYTFFCDIFYMSTKKDGIAHMGGFLATDEEKWVSKIRQLAILFEGFPSYGGLSGKDMEIIAQGLKEVLSEDYLNDRISQVAFLGSLLHGEGIPVIRPFGGHAVFVDAQKFVEHITPDDLVGQSLVVELYRLGGIRSVEVGNLMYGKDAIKNLVRLAIPRRVYTYNQLEYVGEIFKEIKNNKKSLTGFEVVSSDPLVPHFTAILKPKKISL
ncbi:MAG: tryptophanase [Candidatus Calescibacterium sp.]|nr:tryptophanase [Candidatus Calescibacterium sp.]MCX7759033.1 tryptophanase [bacterium]